jgi:dihydrofolate reductase
MLVSIIVAVSENNVIGKDNRIPWRLPADMNWFKTTTMGYPVITGRKNFESIPEKFRPLPGRTNIIITRNEGYQADKCIIVHSLEDALKKAALEGKDNVFIIGGAEIYKLALPIANKLYFTRIHHEFDGDVFFPEIDWQEWKEDAKIEHSADDGNKYACTFYVCKRR